MQKTEGDGWESLFDGRSLAGWSVACLPRDRGKVFWRVDNGAIVCDSLADGDHDYVWLMSDREFDDFELSVRFRAFRSSPGNSGIQVRSRYDAGPDAPRGGWLDGPQVDIHPPGPWRTGYLYDETRETRRWICPDLPDSRMDRRAVPDGWQFHYADETEGAENLLYIVCSGTRVRTSVNGVTMIDWDGAGILDDEAHRRHNVGLSGQIALQLHTGDKLRIEFTEVRIRPLPCPASP